MTGPSESGDKPARQRWPRSVYGAGEEPDPRFSLANERTFLAWIRTTLALLAGAAALDALDLPMPDELQRVVALLLALVALLAAVQAWRGWVRTERAMRTGAPLPSAPFAAVVAFAVAAVAVGLVVAALMR
ncbi:DUF202 domain-containing protein [Intrasporangium sp. DVR]|uniref:YidH family protein n=1 Tax=Intrasporangium sp. DVR TaxID=3127867 RepID=UPI00313A6CE8